MRYRHRTVVLAAAMLTCCSFALFTYAGSADAEVVHGTGFEATVAGWTSWYGSYQLAGIGQTWCIDHGLHAPDAAFGYRPTPPPAIPPTSRTAMSWVLGRYGSAPSAVDAAAIMLVLHDLNGAVYPQGALSVDHLTPGQFAGFGGSESQVHLRAMQIASDGRAHAGLRGPLGLSLVTPDEVSVGQSFTATGRIRDADGRGVAGLPLTVHAVGATPAASQVVTGTDGSFTIQTTATSEAVHLTADALVPSMVLEVYGPAGAPAQRVARSARVTLHATADIRRHRARVRIHKTGDLTPRYPVAGARFVLTSVIAHTAGLTLTVGADGLSPWVTLPTGRYTVSESVAPPGYQRAQPFDVDLTAVGEQTIEVLDHIRRPTLELRKVDADTGAPLAGAVLRLWADPDGDGIFAPLGLPFTTTTKPIDLTTLLPGDYRVTEVRAPDGYEPFTPRTVHLDPGTQAELVLPDRRIPPVTLLPPTTAERPVPPTSSAPPTTSPSSSTTSIPHFPPTTIVTPPPPPTGTTPSSGLPRTGSPTLPLAELAIGLLALGVTLRYEATRARVLERTDR